jgi:hypothetical protein
MKRENNSLLISIIYPKVKKYLADYCKSVQSQDNDRFDILVLNDGFRGEFPLRNHRITIIDIKSRLTPAEIRMLGTKYAIENDYTYVIFSDTDDYFSTNRISVSINRLEKYDFVFNELYIINEKEDVIQKSYYNKLIKNREFTNYLEIVDRNLFGLGNTAVKVNTLKDLFIPKEIITVDWWIFSILLLNKYKGGFIKEAITYYRQHHNNFIGIGNKLNKTILRRGIKVKQIHYKNLLKYCEDYKIKEAAEIYCEKLEEINVLNKYIQDNHFCKKYIEIINENYKEIYSGWWSDILSIEEWKKYDK